MVLAAHPTTSGAPITTEPLAWVTTSAPPTALPHRRSANGWLAVTEPRTDESSTSIAPPGRTTTEPVTVAWDSSTVDPEGTTSEPGRFPVTTRLVDTVKMVAVETL